MASVREDNGRYYARYRNENGRRVEEVMPDVKTLRAARTEANRLEDEARRVRNGERPATVSMTLAALWEKYRPVAEQKASWGSLRGRVEGYILPAFGSWELQRIRPADIDRWLAKVVGHAKSTRPGQPLSPQTREHLRVHLSALYTFAIRKERCFGGENPARAAESVHVPQKPPRFLEREHVPLIIDNVFRRWRDFFAVAVYTGMRAGELRGLKKTGVDLERRVIWVHRSNLRETTKGKKLRHVPIHEDAVPYLESAIAASKGEWVFTGTDGKSQVPLATKLAARMRHAMKKAGLEPAGFTFKDLRSTLATHLYEASGDIRLVQSVLGHSDPRLTERVYAGLRQERVLAKANQLSFRPHSLPTPSAAQPERSPGNPSTETTPTTDTERGPNEAH